MIEWYSCSRSRVPVTNLHPRLDLSQASKFDTPVLQLTAVVLDSLADNLVLTDSAYSSIVSSFLCFSSIY